MAEHMRRREALVGLVTVALGAACLATLSPWAIPVGAVPVSLSLMGVYLLGALFGTWRGLAAVAVYLALGAVGVPVFAGFAGGVGHFLSPTGGFLIGYLACVAVVGMAKRSRNTWLLPVVLLLGTLACYLIGTVWYMAVCDATIATALLVTVVPFLLPDTVKIVVAALLVPPLRRATRQML